MSTRRDDAGRSTLPRRAPGLDTLSRDQTPARRPSERVTGPSATRIEVQVASSSRKTVPFRDVLQVSIPPLRSVNSRAIAKP